MSIMLHDGSAGSYKVDAVTFASTVLQLLPLLCDRVTLLPYRLLGWHLSADLLESSRMANNLALATQ